MLCHATLLFLKLPLKSLCYSGERKGFNKKNKYMEVIISYLNIYFQQRNADSKLEGESRTVTSSLVLNHSIGVIEFEQWC